MYYDNVRCAHNMRCDLKDRLGADHLIHIIGGGAITFLIMQQDLFQ